MDKNIIRIKDFPSNTIDEAILILRDNKRAKKYECTSKFKNIDNNENNKNSEEMIIKEAEFIISDYVSNYRSMIKGLDVKDTYQLYRDYLDNFRINYGRN